MMRGYLVLFFAISAAQLMEKGMNNSNKHF